LPSLELNYEDLGKNGEHLKGKEISLVKVVWGGANEDSATWEL